MVINIDNHEFTEVWDNVLQKKLTNYPQITDYELKNIIDFISYEEKNNRTCEIICKDEYLLNYIKQEIKNIDKYKNINSPKKITECTACLDKGCLTEYVCHTTPIENAINIFKTGKLLSAVKARNISYEELQKENRNAAKDPIDYFDYIMFAWGNCQAGDRLVMERKLKRFPNEEDLSKNFTPGIRFYFKYNDLLKHENATIDGVLPVKIKGSLDLNEWVYSIIIPTMYKEELEKIIPVNLKNRVFYLDSKDLDIWKWTKKVYDFISK